MKPFRFKKITQYVKVGENPLQVLDIGSGSHSPSLAKKWLRGCHYTAVDIDPNYNNDEADIKAMDHFIQMDLTTLDFSAIPDNKYDLIIMSHIIEHLHNGDLVITGLLKKLKPKGLIYIEYPSAKSVNFPSMKETLNFYDDKTHVRIFSLPEITSLLKSQQMEVLKAEVRREWLNIILIPVKIPFQLLTKGYIRGGTLWDLYGFAEYAIARKK